MVSGLIFRLVNCDVLNDNETNKLEYTNITKGFLDHKIEIITKNLQNIIKMKQNKLRLFIITVIHWDNLWKSREGSQVNFAVGLD